MSQQKSPPCLIGFTITIMAICLAASLVLGIRYLDTRPNNKSEPISGPTDSSTNIDNQIIQYTTYADEEVLLIPTNSAVGPGGEPPPNTAIQPTTIPPTAIPFTPVPPTPEKIIFTSYTVQSGDTLYSVAAHFGWTSTISLMAKYDIAADDIVAGNILTPFPVANPAYCPTSRPYVVEESESAYTISQTVGTTIEVLKEMNNLDDKYTVYVTDVICVP